MYNEIYRIAYKLKASGKNPSVALIRAKLSTPTPLPVIVKALQQWKASPELGEAAMRNSTDNPPSSLSVQQNAPLDSSIEQRLTALEQKVDYIMIQLAAKT